MVKITKQQMGQAIKEYQYLHGSCTIANEHCHDSEEKCIPYIECCETHYYNCADNCHEEYDCACQDGKYDPDNRIQEE